MNKEIFGSVENSADNDSTIEELYEYMKQRLREDLLYNTSQIEGSKENRNYKDFSDVIESITGKKDDSKDFKDVKIFIGDDDQDQDDNQDDNQDEEYIDTNGDILVFPYERDDEKDEENQTDREMLGVSGGDPTNELKKPGDFINVSNFEIKIDDDGDNHEGDLNTNYIEIMPYNNIDIGAMSGENYTTSGINTEEIIQSIDIAQQDQAFTEKIYDI